MSVQTSIAEGGQIAEQTAPGVSVPISAHPSNLDPTAELVSGAREELSIFRVRGGFLACRQGEAFIVLFPTQDAARAALASAREVQP